MSSQTQQRHQHVSFSLCRKVNVSCLCCQEAAAQESPASRLLYSTRPCWSSPHMMDPCGGEDPLFFWALPGQAPGTRARPPGACQKAPPPMPVSKEVPRFPFFQPGFLMRPLIYQGIQIAQPDPSHDARLPWRTRSGADTQNRTPPRSAGVLKPLHHVKVAILEGSVWIHRTRESSPDGCWLG